MPKIQVEAQISQEDLLQAVKQLNNSELDGFIDNVIALRAKNINSNLSEKEAELILNINQNLPEDVQKEYNLLINKRQNQELTENEYQKLLNLTELTEKHQAQRLKYLVELANLRRYPLEKVMSDLEIKANNNE